MAEYMARPIISAAARTRLSTLNLWLIFMMNRYLIFTTRGTPKATLDSDPDPDPDPLKLDEGLEKSRQAKVDDRNHRQLSA